jgi:hypothetical protein
MSYRGIPPVRTWKVTDKETGKVVYVDTINKRFARWIANTEFGMWGHDFTVSVVKEKDSGWEITDNINMQNGAL